MSHAYWLRSAFNVSMREKKLAECEAALIGVEFDAFLCRGLSGITIGSMLAARLGKGLVIVRKNGDDTHSSGMIEQTKSVSKLVFVDDFASSGATFRAAMHEAVKGNMYVVGALFYDLAANCEEEHVAIFIARGDRRFTTFVRSSEKSMEPRAEAPVKIGAPIDVRCPIKYTPLPVDCWGNFEDISPIDKALADADELKPAETTAQMYWQGENQFYKLDFPPVPYTPLSVADKALIEADRLKPYLSPVPYIGFPPDGAVVTDEPRAISYPPRYEPYGIVIGLPKTPWISDRCDVIKDGIWDSVNKPKPGRITEFLSDPKILSPPITERITRPVLECKWTTEEKLNEKNRSNLDMYRDYMRMCQAAKNR